jgi:hypothetical protein
VRNILSKLDANDRTHAAMMGIKGGIIGCDGERNADAAPCRHSIR